MTNEPPAIGARQLQRLVPDRVDVEVVQPPIANEQQHPAGRITLLIEHRRLDWEESRRGQLYLSGRGVWVQEVELATPAVAATSHFHCVEMRT